MTAPRFSATLLMILHAARVPLDAARRSIAGVLLAGIWWIYHRLVAQLGAFDSVLMALLGTIIAVGLALAAPPAYRRWLDRPGF